MSNEKLRTINKLQITSLALTIILTFVPAVGHVDSGKYYGVPLQFCLIMMEGLMGGSM